MTRLKLTYFGYILQRQSSLEEKAVMLGKGEGMRMATAARGMDSITVGMGAPLEGPKTR